MLLQNFNYEDIFRVNVFESGVKSWICSKIWSSSIVVQDYCLVKIWISQNLKEINKLDGYPQVISDAKYSRSMNESATMHCSRDRYDMAAQLKMNAELVENRRSMLQLAQSVQKKLFKHYRHFLISYHDLWFPVDVGAHIWLLSNALVSDCCWIVQAHCRCVKRLFACPMWSTSMPQLTFCMETFYPLLIYSTLLSESEVITGMISLTQNLIRMSIMQVVWDKVTPTLLRVIPMPRQYRASTSSLNSKSLESSPFIGLRTIFQETGFNLAYHWRFACCKPYKASLGWYNLAVSFILSSISLARLERLESQFSRAILLSILSNESGCSM